MKKYNNYKDSGVEWIGEIPTHWEVKKIKYLVKEPLKYGANESAEEEKLEDPRYIRITDFGNDGKLKNDTFKSLSFEKAEKFLLSEGDILFARSGATVGKTFLFKDYSGIACFAGYLIKASCDLEKMKAEFLYEFTNSGGYENWKQSIFQQSTIQNIGADKYNQLKIGVPPISEQISIIKYLDKKTTQIDNLIAKKEQFIILLQEERTALINKVVNKGLDTKVKMKDSGIEWLGEIPEHWKLMRIGSLSQCITGYAFKSDNFSFENGIKIVRGDNVTENSLRWGDKTRYWDEYSEVLDKFQLQKNDIVIGMDGSKVGKNYAYVEERDLPLLLVQRVARIRATNELIAKWIHFNIGAYNFKYYINLSKTDPAIPHITLKNITSYPICIPNIDELSLIIEKLNSKLEKLDETLKKSNQEIELLKEYKTTLISEVVTGKIDIREVVLN